MLKTLLCTLNRLGLPLETTNRIEFCSDSIHSLLEKVRAKLWEEENNGIEVVILNHVSLDNQQSNIYWYNWLGFEKKSNLNLTATHAAIIQLTDQVEVDPSIILMQTIPNRPSIICVISGDEILYLCNSNPHLQKYKLVKVELVSLYYQPYIPSIAKTISKFSYQITSN